MSLSVIGIIGILFLLVLMFSKMPVSFSMAFTGVLGFSYVINFEAGMSLLARDIYDMFSSYGMTVIALFVFMGQIAFHSGISKRLFDAAYVLFGSRRGGLAMATVCACAGFSAICGSTNATAATMTTVALPEMRRYKYGLGLATGTLAAAGSLGILIPPSTVFIIYGILTEQSIGKLFAAGILPGFLLAALFMLAIVVQVKRNPSLAPLGSMTNRMKKLKVFSNLGEAMLIFFMVMGGMFFGIFTPTEAAAAGAFLVLALSIIRRQIHWRGFISAIEETVRINCMVMFIVTGAVIFGHFVAVTRIPHELASWVGSLDLPNVVIMSMIIIIYLIGGFFMDSLAMVMLSIPIFFPMVLALGYDPIWFGVVIVLTCEMGVLTPPVGVNVYVVYGTANREIPLQTIFKGVLPMLLALVICILLLFIFPQIVSFLPSLM